MNAVVFAYHDVGVRCLSVLLAHGVDVALVVTHEDDPRENVWFESVERLARANDIEVAAPDDPNAPAFLARVQEISPDFIRPSSVLLTAAVRSSSRNRTSTRTSSSSSSTRSSRPTSP